ncbi:MAG: hypothetical protein ACTHJ4_03310 [Candidatus Nucleicultricaceae bacterium]
MQKKNVLLIALVLGGVSTFSVQASTTLRQEDEDQKASSSIYLASSSRDNSSSSLSNNWGEATPSRIDTFPEYTGAHDDALGDLSLSRNSPTFLGRKKRARSLDSLNNLAGSKRYGSFVSSDYDAAEGDVFPDHVSEPVSFDHHTSDDDAPFFDTGDVRSFSSESWQLFMGGEGEQRSSAIRLNRVPVSDDETEGQVEISDAEEKMFRPNESWSIGSGSKEKDQAYLSRPINSSHWQNSFYVANTAIPVDGLAGQSLMLEMALTGLRKLKFQKSDVIKKRQTF